MGRKSLAEKFYEETSEEEDGEEEIWLVLYDFGSKSNPRFWGNVRRLMGLVGEGSLVQYSVFMTRSRRGAMAAERIARHYYPQVNHPLYEAKVFDLISGSARLAEEISEIRDKPLISKLLDLRVSHLLMMKDAADYLQDSEFLQWIKKYKLHQVLRFSNLLFQTIRKKHPGLLFKDFAFTLVKEGGKRWVYVYLHDRIAVEANHIFHQSMDD